METTLFKVLKGSGVKQSNYHGGSLNGKDIKKVINNITYLFGEFSKLSKLGKRDNCELSNDAIDALCQHFQSVFVLWDGAFLFARKINLTQEDTRMYQRFVDATVNGHANLGLTITPKVRGSGPKNDIFQMVPKSFLSILILSTRYKYDSLGFF
jgi:hypothetical protein